MKTTKLNIIKNELIFPLDSKPTPACHASTIVKMKDGRLAAAWFAGEHENNPDVRIWFSIKNGEVWDAPRALTPDDNIADWNPTLFCDENGRLILIYKSGINISEWVSMVIYSDDNGKTWTEPEELVKGDRLPRGPVKNKMIRLSNGKIIAPASDEFKDIGWGMFFDISDDNGKTWTRTDYLGITLPGEEKVLFFPEGIPDDSYGLIQPTVWEYPAGSGKLHAFARSQVGFVYRANSEDFGSTWSVARPTSIPNNDSGFDAVMTSDGILALLYNPVSERPKHRYPMTLALSSDNGETFFESVDLDTIKGEYSYSAIICDGNRLYMTYTYNRESIKYVEAEIILK